MLVEAPQVPGGRQPLADVGVVLVAGDGQELERTVTKADGSYWLAWAPENTTVTVRAYLRNDNSYPPPVTFRYGRPPYDTVADPGPVVFAASPPIVVGQGAAPLHRDIVYAETSDATPPPAIPRPRSTTSG